MELAFTILILLVLLAVIFLVSSKRLHCTEDEIIKCFRQHGAITQKTAKTLKIMGLRSKSKPSLLMRNRQAEPLYQLWQKGIIHEVRGKSSEETGYYLNEKFVE